MSAASTSSAATTTPPVSGRPPAIRTTDLTKRYGDRLAVDRLTFAVPEGVVASFVGANGAGKTTTIRMLLGLIRPTGGRVEVLGVPGDRLPGYMKHVGALVEAPVIYPTLSGRRNLRVLAALGGHSDRRVDEVLETVGLGDRADDQARRYSLGMKQRLGIAAALLPDPRLLVLDEPTNGLDPPGILEVRALLRDLAERGTTVFLSSHLLAEVEHIADHLVMIAHGQLVVDGPLGQILAAQRSEIIMAPEHPGDLTLLCRIAQRGGHDARVTNGRLRVVAPSDFAGELNRRAAAAGVVLRELREERPSLEETFLSLTAPSPDAAPWQSHRVV